LFMSVLLFTVFAALCGAPQAKPVPARGTLPLRDVLIEGTRRYSAADVVRLSGLRIGRPVTAAEIKAAGERLAATGLFKSLNYRHDTQHGSSVVTFIVAEAAWKVPVTFDNFVWFGDQELVDALKVDVPSFDGTAPASPGAIALISRALQKILTAKAIQGRVEFVSGAQLAAGITTYVFKVVDPGPKVCAIHFPGATGISESELLGRLRDVVGGSYSRSYVTQASTGLLGDLYRERGYWQVKFEQPSAVLEDTSGCAGVKVTVPVNEGAIFSWDRASWRGNAAISSDELDALLGLRSGQVAGTWALDDGLRRVQRAYRQRGYLQQKHSYAPRVNEAARTVVFDVQLEEGPQFHAGTLEFIGLDPTESDALTKRWRLAPGDVYDAAYPDRFRIDEIAKSRPRDAKPPEIRLIIDNEKRVVNVRFVFGNG
jgi:outer membrane protein assembly factor BamA